MSAYLAFEGTAALTLAAFCFLFVFTRITRHRKVSLLDWALLFFGLIHGLAGPLVMQAITDAPSRHIGAAFLLDSAYSPASNILAAGLGVVGISLGWTLFEAGGHRRFQPVRRAEAVQFKALDRLSWSRLMWVMLAIALAAQLLYTLDYGGLSGVIEYSRVIRSGHEGEYVRSRFSFLRPFAGFSLLASYGFLVLSLDRTTRSLSTRLGFAIATLFGGYVLFTWQGRLGIVVATATLALIVALWKQVSPAALVLSFAGAVTIGLFGVFHLARILQLKPADTFGDFVSQELSFVFTGYAAESLSGSSPRLFYDLFVTPLFFLPSRLTAGRFENVADAHTATMLGYAKGEGGVTSGMPLDLLTVGNAQAGLLGVLLWAMAFGAFLRFLQSLSDRIPSRSIRVAVEAYGALKFGGIAVFYSHPEHIVSSNYPFFITIIGLAIYSWIRFRRAPKGRNSGVSHWQDRRCS